MGDGTYEGGPWPWRAVSVVGWDEAEGLENFIAVWGADQ